MKNLPPILCIGSVLWDIIGRSAVHMAHGADVPGHITRLPGGVAMNIAMTLRRFGQTPALLSALGSDDEGRELVGECTRLGLITDYLYLSEDLPTDRYMAVEGSNGLIAAIADAHSLELAGDKILRPLHDGRLGDETHPYDGLIALDGNLTESLLADIAKSKVFRRADLRIAPASSGKAERLRPILGHSGATVYVNLQEANLLCHSDYDTAQSAAIAMVEQGANRVLVTNGAEHVALADASGCVSQVPPQVLVTRVTGAGDTFMAAHIAAEIAGAAREDALTQALRAAADYVSGEPK